NDPLPELDFEGKIFVFTGNIENGKDHCIKIIEKLGGSTKKKASRNTDYLVVATKGSDRYQRGDYGKNMEKSMNSRDQNGKPCIIPESYWRADERVSNLL
ncbi:hypothetical protein N8603_05265, partial [Verrucomicrobiales bacterium]|nr:hypothetical protein [Verrucomicrobiales bacterium]